MPRTVGRIAALAAVSLLICYAFWHTILFQQLIVDPWNVFWNGSTGYNATLIQSSEKEAPVEAASRRLLKPFGHVRIVRVVSTSSSKD